MSGNELYHEIKQLLMHGLELRLREEGRRCLSEDRLRDFIDERSRNIAQAYADRLLPEPK